MPVKKGIAAAIIAALLCVASVASADVLCPGVHTPVVALSNLEFTIDNTSGGVALPTIPRNALFAQLQVKTNPINYTDDGTLAPTTTVGTNMPAGTEITICGDAMKKWRGIRTGAASGTGEVRYYGIP